MIYKKYIEDVLSGKILTGEYVKLAARRHISDLKRIGLDDFPYYMDEKEGKRWIDLAAKCNHYRGTFARRPIVLEPWQQFYFMMQFGWRKQGGGRRFRNSYLEIGRKNGKTTMCAVKAIAHILLDKEAGAQVYFAATKEDQARIGFGDVSEIIKVTPGLSDKFKIFTKSVTSGNSFIKPLGSDSNTQDGTDPSFGIIDEYHAHPDSGMLNVLRTGMGMRKSPMIDIITTAGFNRQLPCYTETRNASVKILEGILQDDTQFALIYTLDTEDDWQDQSRWIKSNPNMIAQEPGYLDSMYRLAKNEGGSMEIEFKTKNLNIWTDTQTTWIADDKWMQCNLGQIKIEPGTECFAGLDLASTKDICALVLLFTSSNGTQQIMPVFFIPEISVTERVKKDGVNYDRWVKEGFIIKTPGNVTDYDFIRAKINELNELYPIKRLAYDRWNSSQLIINLTADGVECFPFGQGFASMSSPTKELEKLITGQQINHGGNPVLRWMNSNIMLMTDPAGNIKINKAKSTEKVDGMVALVMALGNYIQAGGLGQSQNFEILMI